MSEERAETFNLKGDYQFRLRYLDGRYRATIFQWDGTIRASAAGPTEAVAWGQAVIELKKTLDTQARKEGQ